MVEPTLIRNHIQVYNGHLEKLSGDGASTSENKQHSQYNVCRLMGIFFRWEMVHTIFQWIDAPFQGCAGGDEGWVSLGCKSIKSFGLRDDVHFGKLTACHRLHKLLAETQCLMTASSFIVQSLKRTSAAVQRI